MSLVENPADLAQHAPPHGTEPMRLAAEKTPLIPQGPVEYLIVTTPELSASFQPLVNDRIAKGLRSAVVSTDWILANYRQGADWQETVRNFLKVAYAEWGLKYVLFGGDADVLAPRYVRSTYHPVGGSTNIPCDLYFAALDGNWNRNANGEYGTSTSRTPATTWTSFPNSRSAVHRCARLPTLRYSSPRSSSTRIPRTRRSTATRCF
jgi:hypothetical protein